LRCHAVSEKLPKISPFRPDFILHFLLIRSQQHPQIGVLFTSFSTWGTENSLMEINLESTGGDKGFEKFLGVKRLANTCSFVGGRIIVQQEKNLES
jgi:hypothetical protein